MTIGVLVLLSALWLNPVVGRMLDGPSAIDNADVLRDYVWWSVGVGTVLVLLGRRVIRGKGLADDFVLLAIVLGSIILADRFLLTRFGKTMWTYDGREDHGNQPNEPAVGGARALVAQ